MHVIPAKFAVGRKRLIAAPETGASAHSYPNAEIDLKGCAYRSAVQAMYVSALNRIFRKTFVLCAIGTFLRRAAAEEGLPE